MSVAQNHDTLCAGKRFRCGLASGLLVRMRRGTLSFCMDTLNPDIYPVLRPPMYDIFLKIRLVAPAFCSMYIHSTLA